MTFAKAVEVRKGIKFPQAPRLWQYGRQQSQYVFPSLLPQEIWDLESGNRHYNHNFEGITQRMLVGHDSRPRIIACPRKQQRLLLP